MMVQLAIGNRPVKQKRVGGVRRATHTAHGPPHATDGLAATEATKLKQNPVNDTLFLIVRQIVSL